MKTTYGIPYQGSKNQIAKEIVAFLPAADTFYDLFAGGCAISHAAMLNGKYKEIVINDINQMPTQLFMDALNGKYKDEKRWISRENFFLLKDTDPYVKYCWSFSNNGKNYLYGKGVEEFKHGLHLAVFEKDTGLLESVLKMEKGTIPKIEDIDNISERRIFYKHFFSSVGRGKEWLQLRSAEHLMRIWEIEAKNVQGQNGQTCFSSSNLMATNITRYAEDYQNVQINGNGIIYCDIPYKNTDCRCYSGFNHDRFYEWALRADVPIFISEYSMPDDFVRILRMKKRQLSSNKGATKLVDEGIWVPRKVANELRTWRTVEHS